LITASDDARGLINYLKICLELIQIFESSSMWGIWIQWNGMVDWNGGMEWNVDDLDGFNGFSPPYNDHL